MIRFFAELVISTKSLKKQRDVCLSICKGKQSVCLYQKRDLRVGMIWFQRRSVVYIFASF